MSGRSTRHALWVATAIAASGCDSAGGRPSGTAVTANVTAADLVETPVAQPVKDAQIADARLALSSKGPVVAWREKDTLSARVWLSATAQWSPTHRLRCPGKIAELFDLEAEENTVAIAATMDNDAEERVVCIAKWDITTNESLAIAIGSLDGALALGHTVDVDVAIRGPELRVAVVNGLPHHGSAFRWRADSGWTALTVPELTVTSEAQIARAVEIESTAKGWVLMWADRHKGGATRVAGVFSSDEGASSALPPAPEVDGDVVFRLIANPASEQIMVSYSTNPGFRSLIGWTPGSGAWTRIGKPPIAANFSSHGLPSIALTPDGFTMLWGEERIRAAKYEKGTWRLGANSWSRNGRAHANRDASVVSLDATHLFAIWREINAKDPSRSSIEAATITVGP